MSTREVTLAKAKAFAQGWYLELHGKHCRGKITHEKTFRDAARVFEREFKPLAEGERSAEYMERHMDRLRVHLPPSSAIAGSQGSRRVWSGVRLHRRETSKFGKPPARSTTTRSSPPPSAQDRHPPRLIARFMPAQPSRGRKRISDATARVEKSAAHRFAVTPSI